jgi:hypothetical protein
MTAEEIHDFGIELVFGELRRGGYEILSVDTNLGVNPQIVARKDGKVAFVVVRTACYPKKGTIEDRNLEYELIERADKHGATCYFASLGIANAKGKNDEERSQPIKGNPFHVSYEGLLILKDAKAEGVNWKRIYKLTYESRGSGRPLLPTLDEVIGRIEGSDS